MDDNFEEAEKLYRAVLPVSTFWKQNGSLSSAAFKDKNGLSVDRQWDRSDEEAVNFLKERNFRGEIVYVLVQNCNEVQAVVRYLPSRGNKYHSEIHKDLQQKELSNSQAKHLARTAKIVVVIST